MKDKVNEKQIGGDHYKTATGYEHWDWAIECCSNMLEYAASRYVIRDKGKPDEDLRKAIHFIEKIEAEFEAGRYFSQYKMMIDLYGEKEAEARVLKATGKLAYSYFGPKLHEMHETPWKISWCCLLMQWQTKDHLERLKESLRGRLPSRGAGGTLHH